jgi:hypothetical protein
MEEIFRFRDDLEPAKIIHITETHSGLRPRLFTALNLLPSIATPASAKRPSRRHSSTNRAQTWRMAGPLSLRKSAIVL